MRHSTRYLLSMGTGWILVWTALVTVPPLALAGSRAGYDIGIRPPRDSTVTAPGRDHMGTACQTHAQATLTTIDALRTQLHTAQESNNPAHMRAALDEVQQRLAAVKDHIAMCMQ